MTDKMSDSVLHVYIVSAASINYHNVCRRSSYIYIILWMKLLILCIRLYGCPFLIQPLHEGDVIIHHCCNQKAVQKGVD